MQSWNVVPRGIAATQFMKHDLWWKGPNWLLQNPIEYTSKKNKNNTWGYLPLGKKQKLDKISYEDTQIKTGEDRPLLATTQFTFRQTVSLFDNRCRNGGEEILRVNGYIKQYLRISII